MQSFTFEETSIAGLIKIQPFFAEDIRGSFTKDYSKDLFEQKGLDHDLQETFYTNSKKGVIRALHFQRVKQQPKLVRCISGHIYDVVVDLRKNSSTFKQWISFDLYGNSACEILIPAGCAHGYLVIEESIVSYKCSEIFYGEYDDGIQWNDHDLGIDWPLGKVSNRVILAEKDENLQSFEEFMRTYGGF